MCQIDPVLPKFWPFLGSKTPIKLGKKRENAKSTLFYPPTSDPSEMGTSAASATKVLRRGGPGRLARPRSFLSISARLVFALIRLLMRGLKDEPSVSAAPRACTCPTTRSSPNGRRGPTLPSSTMPLGPMGGTWVRPFRGSVLRRDNYLM